MIRPHRKKSKIKAFFLAVLTLAVFSVISCIMFLLNIHSAVALEQELRCGIDEHVHTDGCYKGDFLSCDKVAHVHDGNCYIVLLSDNNVNAVLDMSEGSSLENVIDDVVTLARDDNSAEWSRDEITLINSRISDDESVPDLVLNDDINTVTTVIQEQEKEQQEQQEQQGTLGQINVENIPSGNTSYFAVGDDPDTGNYNANFYVFLDGEWTCIGTLDYTTERQSTRYQNYVIPTSDVLALVNGALGTSYGYNDFDISVSTSASRNFTTSNVGVGSVTTTVAYRQSNSSTKTVRYVHIIPANGSATSTSFRFYTVNFVYPDGNTEKRYVRANTEVEMPGGNYSWSDGAKEYAAGESVTVTDTTTFTATLLGPVTFININYNVAFPAVGGVTVDTAPTIAGLSTTTVTDGYSENASAVIRNVSKTSVEGKVSGNNTGLSRVIQFRGWRVGGSDVILKPNTTLVWEELKNYASGSSLNLTAVWEYNPLQTASFFIRFDSVAVDTEGNITGQDSNLYTNELFAAYVGGVDTSKSVNELNAYAIADTTSDNSYGADQEIRALYGERESGVWLSAFPDDTQVFADLAQYARTGYLSVDGKTVRVEDLNEREYAIRWYVFKSQSDAWHIDGKLVKKEGLIYVYKSFAGNKELIADAKTDFYIDAHDVNGGTSTTLDLTNNVSYDDSTDTYMWEITGVEYGEPWTLTEHSTPDGTAEVDSFVYSEYTVMDARGDQSTAGVGTSLTVNGMTYALDEGASDVLRVEFNNIYNKSNSIVIKKQDSRTGNSIGGATFSLLQGGTLLKFDYDSISDKYIYNMQSGPHTVLDGTHNGYFEISIENFSYDNGPIVIREITPPEGYALIGDIEIGYTEDGSIGILSGNSELIQYVNGVLIIGNSTDVLSVSAKKEWDCPESEWQPVRVELLANDRVVTSVIAGVEPSVLLSADNNWSYTWENLPVYVNGTQITWSLRETVIGTEIHKADGSFVNWLVSYGIPVYTTDANGNTNVLLTVTNTTKRVMLRLTKTDLAMTTQLEGAVFTLEAVDANGDPLAGEIVKTATTGAAGTLIFDNLKSEVRYKLTEVTSPEGYHRITEDMYFTIGETGTVRVEESYYALPGTTAYNMTVRNAEAIPIPESGGGGSSMFYIAGIFTMLAGVCITYLFKRRWSN